jgi:hypothetical protein
MKKTWNNGHLRVTITARLRARSVAHGGLSPPPTMAADTQRTATHRTKMITQYRRITTRYNLFCGLWREQGVIEYHKIQIICYEKTKLKRARLTIY